MTDSQTQKFLQELTDLSYKDNLHIRVTENEDIAGEYHITPANTLYW